MESTLQEPHLRSAILSVVATAMLRWNYNSSFNQYAVAFNDEFIDVSVGSTEKADISYKGRDNNSKLIVT